MCHISRDVQRISTSDSSNVNKVPEALSATCFSARSIILSTYVPLVTCQQLLLYVLTLQKWGKQSAYEPVLFLGPLIWSLPSTSFNLFLFPVSLQCCDSPSLATLCSKFIHASLQWTSNVECACACYVCVEVCKSCSCGMLQLYKANTHSSCSHHQVDYIS